jgi:NADH-quinone oxidoreductase subunit N
MIAATLLAGALPAQTEPPFVGPEVGWWALSPLLTLVGGALLLMLAGALTPRWPKGLYAFAGAFVFGTAGVLAMVQWDDITDNGPTTLVGGAVAFDTFSMALTLILCQVGILVCMLTDDHLWGTPNDGPEVYALYLVAAAGGVVMGAANDLVVLFIGLETFSLALYVLAAMERRRRGSSEAGMKYFVLGSFSSAFFLYGVALVYGATGTTNIGEMVSVLQSSVDLSTPDTLALAGMALMIVGLGFKIAAVPFHVWAPDVYQGAPDPVTAFMAAAGKVAAITAIMRVFVIALPFYRDDWRPVIWLLSVLSLLIGSVLAVVQTDVKRMLAYSSIAHAGYLLMGVEAAAHQAGELDPGPGVPSVFVYVYLYALLIVGSFGIVGVVARDNGGDTSLDAFNGLTHRRPLLALGFTALLLAQAGVPFTSGFVAKFSVIQAAVEEDSYAIALIGMVAAVIAAFFYLRIVVRMWFERPTDGAPVPVPLAATLAIGVTVLLSLVLGVLPGPVIDAADTVVGFAR